MDRHIETTAGDTKLVIDNGKGSWRTFELIQSPRELHEKRLIIEYTPATKTAEIDGIKLSPMQVNLLLEFLTQKD